MQKGQNEKEEIIEERNEKKGDKGNTAPEEGPTTSYGFAGKDCPEPRVEVFDV